MCFVCLLFFLLVPRHPLKRRDNRGPEAVLEKSFSFQTIKGPTCPLHQRGGRTGAPLEKEQQKTKTHTILAGWANLKSRLQLKDWKTGASNEPRTHSLRP